MAFRRSAFTEIANGLGYPEGPVYFPDGSLTVVDVKAGNLVRLRPNSSAAGTYLCDPPISLKPAVQEDKLQFGNGPNGAALGPDAKLYICNNGGMSFEPVPIPNGSGNRILNVPGGQSADYCGGYLQRYCPKTGQLEMLCAPDSVASTAAGCMGFTVPTQHLRGPDDLVFDKEGGLWFTDWGKSQARSRDVTGVYYLPPGAKQPIEKIPLRGAPNGILLSPAGDRLYVAETYSRWILYWNLSGPGRIECNPARLDGANLLTAALPGQSGLDSMAMDEEGNLYAVCILPDGLNPLATGGIAVISPKGLSLDFIPIDLGDPEPLPSNLCFGGADRKTLFVTCGGTGRVLSCQMAVPGLA